MVRIDHHLAKKQAPEITLRGPILAPVKFGGATHGPRCGDTATLFGLFGADVDHVERVCKFVRHLQPPFPPRLEVAVEIADGISSDTCRFPPSYMLVRQFFAYSIDARTVMVNVEKVSRHASSNTARESKFQAN